MPAAKEIETWEWGENSTVTLYAFITLSIFIIQEAPCLPTPLFVTARINRPIKTPHFRTTENSPLILCDE